MDNEKPAEAGKPAEDEHGMSEDEIDLNLAGAFPASDPPSWTLGTDHHDESQDKHSSAESRAGD